LKPGGSIAFYASRGNPAPQLPVRQFIRNNIALRAIGLPHAPSDERRAAQTGISDWLRSGSPRFPIAARLPLEETAAAHEMVERGDKFGTVTVAIGQ
jgi:NADPH2:quinone reductase